jgi:cytidylate kinase
MIPVLTIDGPSGAGKGTVSRAIAQQLAWHYLDSGSIYRALGIACLEQKIKLEDTQAIVKVAEEMHLEFECKNEFGVILNGINITAELGTETTANTASQVASIPEVRTVLLEKQQAFQKKPGLVADGRDMGTVVFAAAAHKVYLTASAEIRAKRRYKQLIEQGISANLKQITQEIQARDKRDTERAVAPLAKAKEALYIDSSDLSIEDVINRILNFIQ